MYSTESAPISLLISFDVLFGATNSSLLGISIPKKQGEIMGGQPTLIWTSFAPASLTLATILFDVLPLTIESSTKITRFPSRTSFIAVSYTHLTLPTIFRV